MIVDNLQPPYFAVIFTAIVEENLEGYLESAVRMEALAKLQKGYLGIESVRSEVGITDSYWRNLEDIVAWKNNVEHTQVRNWGREIWYKKYQLRICKVEREYGFEK